MVLSSRKYWVGFNIVRGIGPAKLRALLDCFGDLETAWNADQTALAQAGLDRRAIRNLVRVREQVDLDAEMAKLERRRLQALNWDDEDYPALLKQICAPPRCSMCAASSVPRRRVGRGRGGHAPSDLVRQAGGAYAGAGPGAQRGDRGQRPGARHRRRSPTRLHWTPEDARLP